MLRAKIQLKPSRTFRSNSGQTIIGWREHIALPELGIDTMPAKIDTGARTSALHAVDQVLLDLDGLKWVEFMIPVHNRRTPQRLRAPFLEERDIKNTGGVPERRFVVRTQLKIGHRSWRIDVSLANREKMEFDIILGRSAIRGRDHLIDPGRSFVLGQPEARRKAISHAALWVSPENQGEEE